MEGVVFGAGTGVVSADVADADGEEADGEEAVGEEADGVETDGEVTVVELVVAGVTIGVLTEVVSAVVEDAGREVIKLVVVVLTEKLPGVVAEVDGEVTDVELAKVVGSVDEGTKVKTELVDVPVELGTSVEVDGWTDELDTGL